MANKPRICPKCDYRTSSASAMDRHNAATRHDHTPKEKKYVQLGKQWKKVR